MESLKVTYYIIPKYSNTKKFKEPHQHSQNT